MFCWHKHNQWKLIQDNKCEGYSLLEKICDKCGKIKRRKIYYLSIHTWSKWVHVGTLRRHFYGDDKEGTLILNKIVKRHCTICDLEQRKFI